MSGSSGVRETIELLSTILQENGASPVTAEVFRLAKFDKDEATSPMWRLLFELVYFCNYGVIDDSALKALLELSEEEKCVVVKRELQSRGYLSHDFAHLPNNASCSSRELLLAFAWLLCKETIIEKFMDRCTSPLDDNISKWCKDYPSSVPQSDQCPQREADMPAGQRVQRLLMLNGKLRLNLRRMYAAQQQEARLHNKIENSTKGVSLSKDRDNLSVLEVHLLRHPQLLKRMLVLLDKDNERLNNLLNWRQHEEVFWKWMDSVLDLKVKVGAEIRDQNEARSGAVYLQVPRDAPRKMQLARQQLVQSILSYESNIKMLEQLWESKENAYKSPKEDVYSIDLKPLQRFEISSMELDNLIAAINMDISVHKANLMLTSAEEVAKTIKSEPVFCLNTKSSSKRGGSVSRGQGHLWAGGDGRGMDIQKVTSELADQIQDMRLELGQLHRDCQKTMLGLAKNIPNSICIEPAAVRNNELYV